VTGRSKQWVLVGAVLTGIMLGGGILFWFGPDVPAVAVGTSAPDMRVYDLATGDSLSLRAHYRGHVTLVNIWATWCAPCKEEMPSMQRLYDSLGSRGFRIAAVSIDRAGPETVRSFAHDLRLKFDILQDQSGVIQERYQTTGVPESFLLDQNGVIMKRVIGAHDWAAPVNTALITRLLEGSGGSAQGLPRTGTPGGATMVAHPTGR
jgi:thiol-disulfide isomerase/thioredoxin